MRKRRKGILDLLNQPGVAFSPLSKVSVAELLQQWCVSFAPEVMEKTGESVYRKIRWHAFAFSYSPHISGGDALRSYFAKSGVPLCVLDEFNHEGFWFTSSKPIDFSECGLDLYVFPKTEDWTMVFTHEQPQIGPFYREK